MCGLILQAGFPSQYRVFDELLVWDGVAQDWTVESYMPERRCYGGLAVLDGELWYCSGATGRAGDSGEGDDRPPVTGCMVYSPTTRQWREGPALAIPRVETASFTAGERIYTFGGSTASAGGETIASVESIGSGETSWRKEPSMPVGLRQFGGAVLDDGKIYLVGGLDYHPDGDLADEYRRHGRPLMPTHRAFLSFDPSNGAWDHHVTSFNGKPMGHCALPGGTLPPHPVCPTSALVAAHGGALWCIAGNPIGQNGPAPRGMAATAEVWTYKPGAAAWERGPDFPTGQAWGACASFKGRLVAISGGHGVHPGVFVFDPRVFVLREEGDHSSAATL